MSAIPIPQTLYLEGAPEPVCAILHPCASESPRDTAVILCPPFGWDEVCSYRIRRDWAELLAAAGYPSIRISLPATGDSGGAPRDAGRLDSWTAAVAATARWLPAATGAQRVAAIGIGLGGAVVYRAAAEGAPIEDLVLWATPGRGRALVRELRAFAKLELSQFLAPGAEQPPPLPAGDLEAGGFLLSAQTIQELENLDLSALPVSTSRRALLLERDGISVDRRLRDRLESSGVAVTIAPGKGYSRMTAQPQQARSPHDLIRRVTAWLDEESVPVTPGAAVSMPQTPDGSRSALTEMVRGSEVRETPFAVAQPSGRLAGILTEPTGPRSGDLCAVLLNAGAIYRIGPNRMWVEAARRWAARGVPTLRLDVEGIGDADGDGSSYTDDAGLYVPHLVDQVLAAVDALQERGVGERFVLGGLCSGAYWSFEAALRDTRVATAMMLNPRALIWDPGLSAARDFRTLTSEPLSWKKIRNEASGARVRALAVWMLASPRRAASRWARRNVVRPTYADELGDAFDRLQKAGKQALLLFSDDEPMHEELIDSGQIARLEGSSNVTLELIHVRDHTLRPGWSQRLAHEALDRAVDRELEISRARRPATALVDPARPR